MKATYKKYILNFKRPSGTSRGIMTEKETWFLILEDKGKIGIGECGILRTLSIDDRPDYEKKIQWVCQNIHLGKDKLCEGLYLEFDQKATPKGYTAINISIVDENIRFKYEIPENIYTTKDSIIKNWEFIERSNWVVTGSSRNSPDDAKYDMMQKAKKLGANALINMQYFKTTGSEPGTGRGTHYYTIHNFRGQMVNIAKKSTYGRFEIKDFKK